MRTSDPFAAGNPTGATCDASSRKSDASQRTGVRSTTVRMSGEDCTSACVRIVVASGTSAMQWSRTSSGVDPWEDPGMKFGWMPSSKRSGCSRRRSSAGLAWVIIHVALTPRRTSSSAIA